VNKDFHYGNEPWSAFLSRHLQSVLNADALLILNSTELNSLLIFGLGIDARVGRANQSTLAAHCAPHPV